MKMLYWRVLSNMLAWAEHVPPLGWFVMLCRGWRVKPVIRVREGVWRMKGLYIHKPHAMRKGGRCE